MTTQNQIQDYLAKVKRYAHAQSMNNPLEVMPDRAAYPALKANHLWQLVVNQAERIFASYGISYEWPS